MLISCTEPRKNIAIIIVAKPVIGELGCCKRQYNTNRAIIKDCTHEIEWVDDDVFYGDRKWLSDFIDLWIQHIDLPMYVSTTSVSALMASDELLKKMRRIVRCVGMGVPIS